VLERGGGEGEEENTNVVISRDMRSPRSPLFLLLLLLKIGIVFSLSLLFNLVFLAILFGVVSDVVAGL
jgi:hypothetical protein